MCKNVLFLIYKKLNNNGLPKGFHTDTNTGYYLSKWPMLIYLDTTIIRYTYISFFKPGKQKTDPEETLCYNVKSTKSLMRIRVWWFLPKKMNF